MKRDIGEKDSEIEEKETEWGWGTDRQRGMGGR